MGAAGAPESRRVISVLLSLAGTVLFIVCLNISGMMLVRGATRERELSIRAALGASRQRLIRHLFFEALVLAFAGGAISAFVLFGVPAIIGWRLGVPVPEEIDLDAANVAIALGLCLVVSMLFGLLPAIRFSRPTLLPALEGRCRRRRTADHPHPSRGGDGANRHRRSIPRRRRRHDRSGADR